MFLSHLYINIIAIAFGVSLISFKYDYPVHLKLLSVLLGLTLLAEFLAVDGMKAVNASNNMAVYNPFMLIEFCGFAVFFLLITRLSWLKKLIRGYLIVFPLFWLVSVMLVFGISTWNSYVSVTGSAFTIFFALVFYYEILKAPDVLSLRRMPEFWVATGLIIFYAGNLPFTGMLNFLIVNYSSVAAQLSFVLKVLNMIMYSMFVCAYLYRLTPTR